MTEQASSTATETMATPAQAAADASSDPLAALGEGSVVGDAQPGADPQVKPAAEGGETAAAEKPAEGEGEEGKEGGDKTADEKPQAGAPETYDLKMPEGVTLDEGAWKVAEPVFKEANIGPEQAQKLADAFPSIVASIHDRLQTDQINNIASVRKNWADEIKADPKLGGANYDANLAAVAKARDMFMTRDGAKEFMQDTGLGNSPHLYDLLLNVGKAIQEGAIHTGAAPKGELSTSEKFFGPGWGPKAS